MYRFLETWDTADHEFRNETLETKRKALYEALQRFSLRLSEAVGPAHITGRLTIGLEDYETRPHMFDLQRRLNALATDAYEKHQDLVRTGRQVLYRDG